MLQKLAKKNEKGFTLIELMIVIAIIGILAAIAIPNFISYRKRAYNTAAKADLKNAYTAAQAYFTDYPSATITSGTHTASGDQLYDYGYRASTDVTVTVGASATQSAFSATSVHSSGDITYTVDDEGAITP